MEKRGFFNFCEVKCILSRGGEVFRGGGSFGEGGFSPRGGEEAESWGGFFSFREVFFGGVCLLGGVLPGLSTRGVEHRVVHVLGCCLARV